MNKQEIKKYLNNYTSLIVSAIITVVALALFVIFRPMVKETDAIVVLLLLFLFLAVMGIILMCSSIKKITKLNKWLDEMERTGDLSAFVLDFCNASEFFDNNLRIGKTYIFMKKAGEVYFCYNIERVYQGVMIKNGEKNGRDLRIKMKDGKVHVLSYITIDQTEINLAMSAIAGANPNIEIGYKE